MRQLFKIHHHKHTGRLIHHRHTSYPALFVIVALVGGLLFFTDRVARADELLVMATVQAPMPSGAPVFTSPDEGTVTSSPTVNFEGTCPIITPAVIIVLYDESSMIGSGACEADGTFHVTATIQEGLRSIVARVMTITNEVGQSSLPLHITYRPPVPAPAPIPGVAASSTPLSSPQKEGLPLGIISEKPFLSFGAGETASTEWRGHFLGGTPPYTVTITWGDGQTQTFTKVGSEMQVYPHTYQENHIFTVSVTVTDQTGHSLTRYYVAVNLVQDQPTQSTLLRLFDGKPQDPLLSLYLLYGSLVALLLAMWRYEYTHHKRVVGVPMHYHWQKPRHQHRKLHQ